MLEGRLSDEAGLPVAASLTALNTARRAATVAESISPEHSIEQLTDDAHILSTLETAADEFVRNQPDDGHFRSRLIAGDELGSLKLFRA